MPAALAPPIAKIVGYLTLTRPERDEGVGQVDHHQRGDEGDPQAAATAGTGGG
jgi:hypothetical protein